MIDPRAMRFEEWSALTIPIIAEYGATWAAPEEQWTEWADAVAALPAMASVGVPTASGFPDWVQWAISFNNQAILLTS